MTDIVTCGPVCGYCLDRAVQPCERCGVYVCAEHCYEGKCSYCKDEDEPLDDHDVCPPRPGAFA